MDSGVPLDFLDDAGGIVHEETSVEKYFKI